MEIRKACKNDLPGILAILNHEIEFSTSVYDEKTRTIEPLVTWFNEKNQLNFPVWVAIDEEKIIGYGTLGKFRPHDGFRFTIEHSIYITSERRGQGIGHLLIEKLIESARELKMHIMVAGIDAKNVKSIKFHEEVGFVEVGRMQEVGYKFGNWLDLVFMQKRL
jgi:L-amino acid N-acyltransferase